MEALGYSPISFQDLLPASRQAIWMQHKYPRSGITVQRSQKVMEAIAYNVSTISHCQLIA